MWPLAFIGVAELWPILLILVLLFGATKLPALARSMGASISQFKKGLREDEEPRLTDGESGRDGGKASE